MSSNSAQGDNHSASIGGSSESSAIQTGTGNTATITITNYYYREDIKVVPVESTDAADDNLPCPYRGLFHFSPNDADVFFGREVFVQELFVSTQTRNFIPVLGASGSGKSSVVLAGLVPKLQNEGHWLFTHFRPGSDPFYALAESLVPLYTSGDSTEQIIQAGKLAQSIRDGRITLPDILSHIQKKHPNHRVLLIADQFEELYTLCTDQKIRRSFVDTLLACFQSSSSRPQYNHVLVTTMRADFLGNALSYPQFGDLLQNADVKIRSMNHEELTQVIEKPAEKLGVSFEGGLVKRILDDVEDEPGNLPLLEFALTELWKRRESKQLTHVAYEAIGEVQGALARHADENYRKLSQTEQEQVRRIFIQLVRPGEGTEDTRRLATKAELSGSCWGLVKHLADARLVVTSRNGAEQETVEVVHEALIRNWGELRQWMDTDRNFRAWQERLRVGMYQWQQMQRDEGALLRGAGLAEAEEKLKQRSEDLSKGEQEFIQASVALRDREQKQRERARRWTISLLAGGLVLALGLSGFSWIQWQNTVTLSSKNDVLINNLREQKEEAEKQKEEAEKQKEEAEKQKEEAEREKKRVEAKDNAAWKVLKLVCDNYRTAMKEQGATFNNIFSKNKNCFSDAAGIDGGIEALVPSQESE
ncbi:MAG: S-layer homology domain-containing protein [Cyanobacteria bacterium P01_A01_bin.84]